MEVSRVKSHYDQKQGKYIIEQFNEAKPFSSFLPGIGGTMGIPLWLYYVNRGQAIASFGIEDKNSAIMEFFPANKSYQGVSAQGFRTFLKLKSGEQERVFEPFTASKAEQAKETMLISQNLLELKGEYSQEGVSIEVEYFTMPGEHFAALVRQVKITNTSDQTVELEILDGIPAIIPYGLNNAAYKELGYTLKSWMNVDHLESKVPLYNLRGSIEDTAEVSEINGGHFYLGFIERLGKVELAKPIVDMELIFAQNTSLSQPNAFLEKSILDMMNERQVTTNKVSGGFIGANQTLASGESISLVAMIGHVKEIKQIHERIEELADPQYILRKKEEAVQLVQNLTRDVDTKTSEPLFDAYVKQCYLDNFLRGGYPLLFDNGTEEPFVYHVYSRKHGDLERDYNFFKLLPGFYSQGNGNFRDANQNRRCDVLLNPEVRDFNIRMFMSFIQSDGYNPLVVKGCSFVMANPDVILPSVALEDRVGMLAFLSKPFNPGALLNYIHDRNIRLTISAESFMLKALSHSEQQFDAEFGEGYWIDHWTYNMDLIESYLMIYPDQLEALLYDNKVYTYFDSPARVVPRTQKYVLTDKGKVRQYGAVEENKAKEHSIIAHKNGNNWVKVQHGQGEVYKSTLFEKLLSLAAIKFATLDPEGLGVEMEAGKPGWNDSLNGLPGLIASGFSETCELKRLVDSLYQWNAEFNKRISLPVEVGELIQKLVGEIKHYQASEAENKDYIYWDQTSFIREKYRDQIKEGFSGEEAQLTAEDNEEFLVLCIEKLDQAMEKALSIGKGIYPTYFYYEAVSYTPVLDGNGRPVKGPKELQYVNVQRFSRVDLPYFLEGPTRAMKVTVDMVYKQDLYHRIKASGMYDQKLKMYKVNESLADQPLELGRSTIFTPGWLENESVFMHMEYKYLLELLRAGLYEAFFENIRYVMPPFLDPAIYGRNQLENSSFIASSANPDESLHGRGFVARLSGSTAEFLNMWFLMMVGKEPFTMDQRGLKLQLAPKLPAWMFDVNDQVQFQFLGCCHVTYYNPKRVDTYNIDLTQLRYGFTLANGDIMEQQGAITEPYASMVRNKQVIKLNVSL
jgi:hypothetical protein